MTLAESDAMVTMPSPVQQAGDESMLGRERWEEIRRLFYEGRRSIARIVRLLDLDRRNVAVSFTTVAGAVCAWAGLSHLAAALAYFLAVAASSFIYVAVADLIPGLHARTASGTRLMVGIGPVYRPR